MIIKLRFLCFLLQHSLALRWSGCLDIRVNFSRMQASPDESYICYQRVLGWANLSWIEWHEHASLYLRSTFHQYCQHLVNLMWAIFYACTSPLLFLLSEFMQRTLDLQICHWLMFIKPASLSLGRLFQDPRFEYFLLLLIRETAGALSGQVFGKVWDQQIRHHLWK